MKRQRYGILKTPAVLFNFLILPALIAAAWYVATATGAMSTLILPRLGTVFQTFIQQITSGVLPGDLAVSLSRIVKGYSLAVIFGILLGVIMGINGWQQFVKIYLPSALPSIFVGLKLGLSVSWMAVVGAEMIAATSGIGFRINDARSLMQYPVVFSGIIAIAVVGVVMDQIISLISKLCTPWERER